MSDNRNDNSFVIGLFIGGIIGAATMFLFGTKKGKEVRAELQDKGEDILDDVDGIVKKLEEKGKVLEKKAVQVKEDVSEKVTDGLDDTLAHIEALQERGREATSQLRKKYFLKAGKKLG